MSKDGSEVQAQMQLVGTLPTSGRPLYFADAPTFGEENAGFKIWDEQKQEHVDVEIKDCEGVAYA